MPTMCQAAAYSTSGKHLLLMVMLVTFRDEKQAGKDFVIQPYKTMIQKGWSQDHWASLESELYLCCLQGFPGGSDGKESACNAGDPGLIPGLGGSPGEEKGNSFQYSCLYDSINKGAWQATLHGVTKSWTLTFSLSTFLFTLLDAGFKLTLQPG